MLNKYIITTIFLFSVFIGACSIDPAVNNNPNGITKGSLKTLIGQSGLLTALQTQTGEFYWGDRSRISSIWTWQMCGQDGLGRAQPAEWTSYVQSADGPMDDMWKVGFKCLKISSDIMETAPETNFGSDGIKATFLGINNCYRAMLLAELSAFYGSIPIKQSGFSATPFVSQTEVYTEVQRLLDEALVNFAKAEKIDVDLNFKGDKMKWIEVCNSLKARYYLHIKNYAMAKDAATKGMKSGALNAIFSDATGERGPWAHWAKDEAGEPIRLEKTYADLLNSEAGDTRGAEYFMSQFNGKIIGIAAHRQKVADTNESNIKNIASLKKYSNYSDALPFISANENTLILAECEARAGALPNAVTSLNTIRKGAGLTDFNAPTDKDKVISEILKQKNLSLFLEGQTYTDMRRTGTLPETAVPVRFIYPQSETNANPNVPKDDDKLVSAILP